MLSLNMNKLSPMEFQSENILKKKIIWTHISIFYERPMFTDVVWIESKCFTYLFTFKINYWHKLLLCESYESFPLCNWSLLEVAIVV